MEKESAIDEFKKRLLNNVSTEKEDELYKYVGSNICSSNDLCSLAPGSDLSKPMLISMDEKLWNTIDRHVNDLRVSKSLWVRNAIRKIIKQEQLICKEKKKDNG